MSLNISDFPQIRAAITAIRSTQWQPVTHDDFLEALNKVSQQGAQLFEKKWIRDFFLRPQLGKYQKIVSYCLKKPENLFNPTEIGFLALNNANVVEQLQSLSLPDEKQRPFVRDVVDSFAGFNKDSLKAMKLPLVAEALEHLRKARVINPLRAADYEGAYLLIIQGCEKVTKAGYVAMQDSLVLDMLEQMGEQEKTLPNFMPEILKTENHNALNVLKNPAFREAVIKIGQGKVGEDIDIHEFAEAFFGNNDKAELLSKLFPRFEKADSPETILLLLSQKPSSVLLNAHINQREKISLGTHTNSLQFSGAGRKR